MTNEWFATLAPPDDGQASQLLPQRQNSQSLQEWTQQLRHAVAAHLQDGRAAAVLAAGRQYLLQFVEASMIGPIGGDSSNNQQRSSSPADAAEDSWVAAQLQVDGEDVVGRCPRLDLLLAALACLAEPLGPTPNTSTPTSSSSSSASSGQDAATAAPSASAASNSISSAPAQQRFCPQQQGLGSWHWWCMRALLLQQQVLSGRSATIRRALQQQLARAQQYVQQRATAAGGNGLQAPCGQLLLPQQAQLLLVLFELEAAAVHRQYGYVNDAAAALEAACAAAGLQVEVTGALGMRTVHQIDPKAQLVAWVSQQHHTGDSSTAASQALTPGSAASASSAAAAATGVLSLSRELDHDLGSLHITEVGLTQELQGMEDDSAVYAVPKLLQEPGAAAAGTSAPGAPAAAAGQAPGDAPSSSSSGQQGLAGVVQAIMLGYAAQVKKGTGQSELQHWQMAPYVEAVLQQQTSQFALQVMARLLKTRHERERSRTRERSLMQLEQLCSALCAAEPPEEVRTPYLFTLNFPLWVRLRKELAETYIGMGFVGAALEIYEALEMWDQLIVCYRLLDKKAAAQEVISQRLKVDPDNPRLWCALGDVQQQEEHYRTAWRVSNHRSARAQRSLGRSAYNRKDYAAAAGAWELALGLSPLYPDAWFNLGYCYLKLGQQHKALQAFTQVTYLDPEQGEAWHNISALWMQLGAWKRACNASEQAVRIKRDNWQAWDNYAAAAARAGNYTAAVRAVQQVLQLSRGELFRDDVMEVLLRKLEHWGTPQQQQQQMGNGTVSDDTDELLEEELDPALSQALQQLADLSVGPSTTSTAEEPTAAAADQGTEGSSSNGITSAAQQQPGSSASTNGSPGEQPGGSGRSREYQQLLEATGRVLKAVVNSPSCGAAAWGLLGRWYLLQGEVRSAQEAALKEVRALAGSGYANDPQQFERMAAASLALAQASLQLSSSSESGGIKDLAAARLHLNSVLRQCAERFGDADSYKRLQQQLEQLQEAVAALQKND